MRMFRLAGIAVAALVVAGCFQSTTLIRVNADGSGTIEQTTLVTEAALRQLRQFAAANDENGKRTDLFSIDQARQIAEAIGSDVTVVSSTRIKTAEGEGSKAVLAFPDINRLRIKQGDASEGGADVGGAAIGLSAAQVRFALTREADGRSVLRISLPPAKIQTAAIGTAPAGSGGRPQSHIAPEHLAVVKQIFTGMRVSVAVEPIGQLVKTSSPFVDGPRVTLVDVAFDQLLANDAAFARLQTARTIDDVRAAIKDVPGLKVNLDPEITIEFMSAKQPSRQPGGLD